MDSGQDTPPNPGGGARSEERGRKPERNVRRRQSGSSGSSPKGSRSNSASSNSQDVEFSSGAEGGNARRKRKAGVPSRYQDAPEADAPKQRAPRVARKESGNGSSGSRSDSSSERSSSNSGSAWPQPRGSDDLQSDGLPPAWAPPNATGGLSDGPGSVGGGSSGGSSSGGGRARAGGGAGRGRGRGRGTAKQKPPSPTNQSAYGRRSSASPDGLGPVSSTGLHHGGAEAGGESALVKRLHELEQALQEQRRESAQEISALTREVRKRDTELEAFEGLSRSVIGKIVREKWELHAEMSRDRLAHDSHRLGRFSSSRVYSSGGGAADYWEEGLAMKLIRKEQSALLAKEESLKKENKDKIKHARDSAKAAHAREAEMRRRQRAVGAEEHFSSEQVSELGNMFGNNEIQESAFQIQGDRNAVPEELAVHEVEETAKARLAALKRESQRLAEDRARLDVETTRHRREVHSKCCCHVLLLLVCLGCLSRALSPTCAREFFPRVFADELRPWLPPASSPCNASVLQTRGRDPSFSPSLRLQVRLPDFVSWATERKRKQRRTRTV